MLGSVGTHAQNQWLYKQPAYNAVVLSRLSSSPTPLVLVTRPTANNLRSSSPTRRHIPGELKFGSAGVGSAIISAACCSTGRSVQATHISYRGGGPAMQDLIASRIDYNCQIITSASPQVRDKQVKAPALLGAKRAPLLPDLATAQEQGLAGFDAGSWNIVFLPKGTPEPIVRKLNAALSEAMDSPETTKRLLSIGVDIPPKDCRASTYAASFVEQEIKKYEAPIKASGIVIE